MPPFEEFCAEIRGLWDSHWLTNNGEKALALEAALRAYLDAPHVVLFSNGHLALVFNDISAAQATERRLSLYDEIEDEDDAPKNAAPISAAPQANSGRAAKSGRTAFWGTPRAPMTLAISQDGGRTWPYQRNLETGDGYCMSNNSAQQINREFSYPSIKQTADGTLHIAYTYWRQKIKYVRVSEDWVKG